MRIGIAIVLLLSTLFLSTLHIATAQQLVKTINYDESLTFFRPRVALADDGAFAVAWETLQKLTDAERWQIAIQQFRPAGVPLDTLHYLDATLVGREGDAGLRNAELAFNDTGRLWLSMEYYVSTQTSPIKESTFTTLGSFYDAYDFQLASLEPGHDPLEEDAGAHPRMHIGEDQGLYLTRYGSSDRLVALKESEGVLQRVASLPALDAVPDQLTSWHDIAAGLNKRAVVWQACSNEDQEEPTCEPQVQFVTNSEVQPRHRITEDSGSFTAFRPSISMNAIGQAVVVWIDYRHTGQGQIFGQRFDTMGRPVGDNFVVSEGDGFIDDHEGSRPEVAIRTDGSFLVVWTDHGDEGMRAWGRYFDERGEAQRSPFLLDGDLDAASGFPDVATNGDDYAFTWLSEREGHPSIFVTLPSLKQAYAQSAPTLSANLSLKGYPNPFSKNTTLEYSLESSGHVSLVIYDLLGREVKKLIDQPQGPGSYQVTLEGEELAMGFYISRLQQGDVLRSQLLIRN